MMSVSRRRLIKCTRCSMLMASERDQLPSLCKSIAHASLSARAVLIVSDSAIEPHRPAWDRLQNLQLSISVWAREALRIAERRCAACADPLAALPDGAEALAELAALKRPNPQSERSCPKCAGRSYPALRMPPGVYACTVCGCVWKKRPAESGPGSE